MNAVFDEWLQWGSTTPPGDDVSFQVSLDKFMRWMTRVKRWEARLDFSFTAWRYDGDAGAAFEWFTASGVAYVPTEIYRSPTTHDLNLVEEMDCYKRPFPQVPDRFCNIPNSNIYADADFSGVTITHSGHVFPTTGPNIDPIGNRTDLTMGQSIGVDISGSRMGSDDKKFNISLLARGPIYFYVSDSGLVATVEAGMIPPTAVPTPEYVEATIEMEGETLPFYVIQATTSSPFDFTVNSFVVAPARAGAYFTYGGRYDPNTGLIVDPTYSAALDDHDGAPLTDGP